MAHDDAMRPAAPTGPFWLTHVFRGPEFAFAIPRGDTQALVDAARVASRFWNGVGAPMLAVDARGHCDDGSIARRRRQRSPEEIGALLPLPVERVLVHPKIAPKTRAVLERRWPGRTAPLDGPWLDDEVPPLHLRWAPEQPSRILRVPAPTKPVARMLVTLAWGVLDPVYDLSRHYPVVHDEAAEWANALVEGQVTRDSPLGWAARLTGHYRAINPPMTRQLFVFAPRPSFRELLIFWNLRARRNTQVGECKVLGVPATAFARDDVVDWIRRWAAETPINKPEFLIAGRDHDRARAEAALTTAGFLPARSERIALYSTIPGDREAPEYGTGWEGPPHYLRRGRSTRTLANLRHGTNPLQVAPVEEVHAIRWHAGNIRVDVRGLPLTLPVGDELAGLVHGGALACADADGITIAREAEHEPFAVDIRIPPLDVQLTAYLVDRRIDFAPSGAGKLATVMIGRLAGPHDLTALASPHALGVLEALSPRTPKKVSQHVANHLRKLRPDTAIDEQLLARLVRETHPLGDEHASTLGELAGAIGARRPAALRAVSALSAAGFVRQGRRVTCPRCDTEDFWTLGQLDERLTCPACGEQFPTPVMHGDAEASTAYRLDGLTRRVMDQDLVPVLLTLRHLLRRPETSPWAAWWPGLDLTPAEGPPFEIDLLVADRPFQVDPLSIDRPRIWAVECKARAEGLPLKEARRHIGLARTLGAAPVLAAPAGEWHDDVVSLFEDEPELLILGPDELLGS